MTTFHTVIGAGSVAGSEAVQNAPTFHAVTDSGGVVGPTGPQGPEGPSVSDGDKGDISVSASGTSWTINANAIGPDEINVQASGTGAVSRDLATKLRDIGYVEDYGAVGDGSTDDSAAFTNAIAECRNVRARGAKQFVVGDVALLDRTVLDLGGSRVFRTSGASHIFTMNSVYPKLLNADLSGQGVWVSTTVASAASAGATTLTVASAMGIATGTIILYPSDCDEGLEWRIVTGVAGAVITLDQATFGNVTSGVKLLADTPLVKMAGSSLLSPTLQNVNIRNCLVGLQRGEHNGAGRNTYGRSFNVYFEDIAGIAVLDAPNSAGEGLHGITINGGKTLSTTYTGNGSQTTFAFSYNLAPIVHRWGNSTSTDMSIKVRVNGTLLNTSQYTVSGSNVVLSTAPASGATVQVSNVEFTPFGWAMMHIGTPSAPSAVGKAVGGLIITCRVGIHTRGDSNNPELLQVIGLTTDTCSYAGAYFRSGNNIKLVGCDLLYTPRCLIVGAGVADMAVSGLTTSLMPTTAEFSASSDRADVTFKSGATRVVFDWESWNSSNGSYIVSGANGLKSKTTHYAAGAITKEYIAGGTDQPAEILLKSSRSTANEKYWHVLSDPSTGNISFKVLDDDGASNAATIASVTRAGKIKINKAGGFFEFSNAITISQGTGSPEGVLTAPVGSIYVQSDGVRGSVLWHKITGTGNTGWSRVTDPGPPTTVTANYSMVAADRIIINNKTGTALTLTLQSAATYPGREITVLNYQALAVNSASSNVVPRTGGAAGTAILGATAGAWARLVSDGTNWVVVEAG